MPRKAPAWLACRTLRLQIPIPHPPAPRPTLPLSLLQPAARGGPAVPALRLAAGEPVGARPGQAAALGALACMFGLLVCLTATELAEQTRVWRLALSAAVFG